MLSQVWYLSVKMSSLHIDWKELEKDLRSCRVVPSLVNVFSFGQKICLTESNKQSNCFAFEKKVVDLSFPVATLILKGTNILRQDTTNKKDKVSFGFNPFFFFWNMACHTCFFTFLGNLKTGKDGTVNLICWEKLLRLSSKTPKFLHYAPSRRKNTCKKNFKIERKQTINPFQNAFTQSLLFNSFVQLSSESCPPKNFE